MGGGGRQVRWRLKVTYVAISWKFNYKCDDIWGIKGAICPPTSDSRRHHWSSRLFFEAALPLSITNTEVCYVKMKYLERKKPVQFPSEDLPQSAALRHAACPGQWLVQRPRPSAEWSRQDQWPHSRCQDRGPTKTWTDASTDVLRQSCFHQQDGHWRLRDRGVRHAADQAGCHRNMLHLQPTDTHMHRCVDIN